MDWFETGSQLLLLLACYVFMRSVVGLGVDIVRFFRRRRQHVPLKITQGLCDCALCKKMLNGAAALIFTKVGDSLEVHTAMIADGPDAEALGHMANTVLQNLTILVKDSPPVDLRKFEPIKFDS